MANPCLLKKRCLQVIQDLASEEKWQLSNEGIGALADAILPFVQKSSGPDDRKIQRIALNYYRDGPMVQQMLARGSPDGEQLWETWRARFLSWARSRGVPADDAQDLAQDVAVQAGKALNNFRFECGLGTYLKQVFLNVHKYQLRKLSQRERREVLAEGESAAAEVPEQAIQGDHPSPETVVVAQEEIAAMRKLIEEEVRRIIRSEDFRILYWYYVEEMYIDEVTGAKKRWTDEAIGERLGMPRNTVTARRHRALRRLRNNPRLRRVFSEQFGLRLDAAQP